MLRRSHPLLLVLAPCLLLAAARLRGQPRRRGAAGAAGGPDLPARRPRGHRLRRLHRPDRGGPVGGHPPAGHRLPGEDAVQGRGRGQGGRPALRGRPAAVQGPARPGAGPGRPLQGVAQAGQGRPCARDVAINARQPDSISQQQLDQDQAVGRRGRGAGQGLREEHGDLQAQPRIHQGHLADRRPDQPLLPDPRQPGQPGPDAADDGRLGRPDVRLLRHGRAHPAAHPAGDQRGEDQAARRTATLPVLMGLQGEDGFPHEGTINFVNNQVNPTTGSILVRGVFANPRPPGGTGCSRRACSCGSACRSACRTRRCWSSTGPSGRTRG